MGTTAIFRRFLPLALLAIVGCAPLPIAGLAGGLGLPAVRDMPACGVSVRFSGYPEQLPADVVQGIKKHFGEYAKMEITGWRFAKHRLLEAAVCACRDFPFTAADVENHPGLNATHTYAIAGIGEAVENEEDKSAEEKLRNKRVRLKNAPRCILEQTVMSPEPNSAAATFFPSLALMPIAALSLPVQPSSNSPAEIGQRSVAERLRQLDQLLSDRLISQDEYNKRRRVVLESL